MTPARPAAPPARRRWRFLMKALGLLVVAIAAFVGFLAYREYANDRLLREAIAEVEATDPHWRMESLEAQRAIVPDAENSANIIRQARASIQFSRRRVLGWVDLSPEIRLTEQQYQDATAMLATSPEAIDAALTLTRYPRGSSRIDFTADVISTALPHRNDAQIVYNRVLEPLLMTLIHEGDGPGALQVCRAILNLGRSVGDEPIPVSQLNRGDRLGEAVRGAERLLGQGEAPEGDLAALQPAIAEEAEYDPWAIVLRSDRATLYGMLESVRRGEIQARRLRTSPPKPSSFQAINKVRAWLDEHFTPDTRPAEAEALHFFTRMLETAAMPWPDRRTAVKKLAVASTDIPEFAGNYFTSIPRIAAALQAALARGRCGVAMIAVERYRLRHGAWPESLAALVPDLLPAVPLDPFDGQPLRYCKLADGVVIYSVGEDGKDDGGELNDGNMPAPGTDLGVRLWDVPKRRQPPPEGPR